MGDILEHKCPSCGGTLSFDAVSQNVKCPFCDSEFDVSMFNDGDLNKVEVNEQLELDAGSEWGDEAIAMSEYNCDSCGGEIYCDENTSATMCPYCGNAVILKGRLSGTLKPDLVIPFKTTADDAKEAFRNITKGKILARKNFIEDSRIEDLKGLYVPYWIYDADLYGDIKYKGMIEHRYTSGDYDVVEKNYYAVTRAGDISFRHVPVDASAKIDDTIMESIEPFDFGDAVDFKTAYLSGYLTDKYDVENEVAAERAFERMGNGTADIFRQTVVGYDSVSTVSKNVSVKASSSNYALYPTWFLGAKYNDETLTFAMNGQTGKMVGNIPVDKTKSLIAGIITFALSFALFFGIGIGIIGNIGIGAVIVGICGGALITFIVMFLLIRQLKMIRPDNSALNYYKDGSLNLHVSTDIYLYKTVSRHKRN